MIDIHYTCDTCGTSFVVREVNNDHTVYLPDNWGYGRDETILCPSCLEEDLLLWHQESPNNILRA